jgi:hypothetical protein
VFFSIAVVFSQLTVSVSHCSRKHKLFSVVFIREACDKFGLGGTGLVRVRLSVHA